MPKSQQPCDNCGSSDAVTLYDDGHSYCFSCKKYTPPDKKEEEKFIVNNNNLMPIVEDFRELTDRGISKATAEKYKVFKSPDPFYSWVYPLFNKGKHVSNKYRLAGDKKDFRIDGEISKAELFGQWLFPPGSSKAITVTEGYDDAMAAFELTGSKYPCVSIHSASSARKDCSNSYEYLSSFPEIILCFDRDEPQILPSGEKFYPGQEAAKKVAAIFPAKKVRILTLQKHKDANDYLRAGEKAAFIDEWWKAPSWTPDGIRLGSSLWDDIKTQKNYEKVDYPFPGLNLLTYGIRLGELVVITADTGVGKTSVLKEIEYYLLNHSQYGLGIMHLEESNSDTGLGIMSIEANKPLHLPDVRDQVTEEELKKYYDNTVNSDRVIIYDHFGSNDISDLLAKIRHMAALGAKYIVLDHLSIVVSDQNGDERKQLDEVSTKIKMICMELNVAVLAVIHQNRQGQIRGTAGVEQLANIVIKLFRDKEADDSFRRNVTKVLVQKNRFCGRTGPACYLQYNPSTGRLEELDKEGIKEYELGKEKPSAFGEDEW